MSWNNAPDGGPATEGYGGSGGFDGFSNDARNYGGDTGFGGGDFGDSGGGDRACFNCGQPGHNKADCPVPRQFSGECNSCGKEGHMSKDCPDAGPMVCRRCKKAGHMARECSMPVVCPRCGEGHHVSECSMPMICRVCSEEGHLAKDCPSAPPRVCNNCQEEGHETKDCKSPRKIIRDDVPEKAPDKALEMIRAAVAEKDLDDVKAAFLMYVKACPDVTYVEMEQMFRNENIGVYLIGVERSDLSVTLTNMDLQGNLDRKYTVTFRFQDKPSRPREKSIWPANTEENLARLANGGEPVARGIPLCMNCRELGHTSRSCPNERMENTEHASVACQNCGSEGHRLRDCKAPRVDKFACRNCGQSGHTSKECTEPRSAEGVECRKCSETGHFSRDCPRGGGGGGCRNCGQEGHMARDCTVPRKIVCRNCDQEGHTSRDCPEPLNMEKMQCRNCDEYGHMSKDCSQPRNMERVRCSNCNEMGHFQSKCPGINNGGDGGFDDRFGGGNDFDSTADVGQVGGGGSGW
ncbi:hypothetical protein HMPREF1624_05532 [Sporothrix schenckii ATCC 58251]|uniref:CCHC-type domain-containing protein n=1 Tax=Sporothrix schenckii (strain ATCC 58251 / de Perez 2211183) TaxID=1391915 RepID=U7PVF2_SPOS1|nr:hypothetical protein HMPREF1624_05532 [Sporothrix schenckii ATCC 58251]